LLARLRAGFGDEFRADQRLRGQLAERFRAERAALEGLVAAKPEDDHPLAAGLRLLAERSARLAPVMDQFRALDADHGLTRPLPSIAASLVHMHLNRLLRSAQRAHELVIYDFLARMQRSLLARTAGSPPALPGVVTQ
jgi:thiopeptide-type bacteriocin biosynthesis protein